MKYNFALLVFAVCFLASVALMRSPTGRILIAIRENEARTRLLGYDTFRYKLLSLVISGVFSGAAGAAYALLFSYVGSTFASVQYSIYPLLWALLGGIGTTLGPIVGTALMFYLVDISERVHLGLSACRGSRAGVADPVLSQGDHGCRAGKVDPMAAVTLLENERSLQELRRAGGRQGCRVPSIRRRDQGHHRAQRGGQDQRWSA